jgi:hypothetical protein
VGSPVFVVGDVHGHRDVLVEVLRTAGLLGADESWAGADARLWFLGDLVDRGPDGVGAIDLVRRLEAESCGAARCLLGNHEVLLLAVRRFAGEATSVPGESFYGVWRLNGGVEDDLRRLTDGHVRWITGLPPIAREGGWLVVHADTHAYLELGASVDAVAEAAATILSHGSADELDGLLGIVSDRMRLVDPAAIDTLLGAYGGSRIVHGHTPIASVLGVAPRQVTEPLVYADGRVVNADHCLFAGGPGFVVRLDGGSGPEA